jgi:hypothetical protein
MVGSLPWVVKKHFRERAPTQNCHRRDRHRYRQELVPRRGPGCAQRHRATAKVVAWRSGSAARQYTALPDRHGSLRRRTSLEPQTRIAWARCRVDAGQICPPLYRARMRRMTSMMPKRLPKPCIATTMKFVASNSPRRQQPPTTSRLPVNTWTAGRRKVDLKLRYRQMLPSLRLSEKRVPLERTECRCLAV